jgi:hypothetical protein
MFYIEESKSIQPIVFDLTNGVIMNASFPAAPTATEVPA